MITVRNGDETYPAVSSARDIVISVQYFYLFLISDFSK